MAVVLEIKDGMAVGPIHTPMPERGIGNLVVKLEEAGSPYRWPSLCGVTGVVYRRRGILALYPGIADCFGCRVIEAQDERRQIYRKGPLKYATEAERLEARRQTFRESKRRSRRSTT